MMYISSRVREAFTPFFIGMTIFAFFDLLFLFSIGRSMLAMPFSSALVFDFLVAVAASGVLWILTRKSVLFTWGVGTLILSLFSSLRVFEDLEAFSRGTLSGVSIPDAAILGIYPVFVGSGLCVLAVLNMIKNEGNRLTLRFRGLPMAIIGVVFSVCGALGLHDLSGYYSVWTPPPLFRGTHVWPETRLTQIIIGAIWIGIGLFLISIAAYTFHTTQAPRENDRKSELAQETVARVEAREQE